MAPGLRLAYITTRYPALSHTFILREVAALRRLGAEVHTISLRRTSGEHLLSRENRDAAQSTYAVRPPRPRKVLSVHLGALLRHPRAYLSTLREALGCARCGARGRLWQSFYFAEAIMVWRHCAAHEVRHLHAHHGSAPADVALLAAHFGAAVGQGPRTWSLTLHGPNELRDVSWFGLAEKVRRADAVACISDFARSQLMALVDDSHWAKLRVVHCGVTPREFATLRMPPASRSQVLCVGRLVAEKGHAVLLSAVATLVGEGHDVEAVLVGSGPLQPRLERLAAELGMADRVVFRGALAQEQVRDCYASASLFCSSSFAEGVPVVLMEAMACGTPVIATAISGVRELVRDGQTGLLVAPGRPDELARAIATLLRDPQLGAQLARAGKDHVYREYDIDRSAAQLAALFGELLLPSDQRLGASAPRADLLTAGALGVRAASGELPVARAAALDAREAAMPPA
jgi:glycosyltransferase involved in cell wall biosynthesis